MKNSAAYFFKTQLTIMFVFNFVLLIAYIPLIIFSMVVFGMLHVQKGMDVYSYVACAVPIIVFFCCGVYYKNAKNYYLSYVTPRFLLYASGKTYKSKSAIARPENILMRYLPIIFPVVYTLICALFYGEARFNQLVLLINVPYNWIFLTPAWYMVFSNSNLNSFFFPIILPVITYSFFFIGYVLGDKAMFNRFFKDKNKKEDQ